MRASRLARLPLGIALIAMVVIGGPALAARVEPAVDTAGASFGRGAVRAVDATIADSADRHAGRADRHAPRNHDLPLLLPIALFAIVLLLLGVALAGPARRFPPTSLRGTIGSRAPPTFAAR